MTVNLNNFNDPIFIPKKIIEEWIEIRFPEFIQEIAVTKGFPDDGPNSSLTTTLTGNSNWFANGGTVHQINNSGGVMTTDLC